MGAKSIPNGEAWSEWRPSHRQWNKKSTQQWLGRRPLHFILECQLWGGLVLEISVGRSDYWEHHLWNSICICFKALVSLCRSEWKCLCSSSSFVPGNILQGPPLRSVSETAWNWLYEFPKYFIVLLVVGLIIKTLIKRQKQVLSWCSHRDIHYEVGRCIYLEAP